MRNSVCLNTRSNSIEWLNYQRNRLLFSLNRISYCLFLFSYSATHHSIFIAATIRNLSSSLRISTNKSNTIVLSYCSCWFLRSYHYMVSFIYFSREFQKEMKSWVMPRQSNERHFCFGNNDMLFRLVVDYHNNLFFFFFFFFIIRRKEICIVLKATLLLSSWVSIM